MAAKKITIPDWLLCLPLTLLIIVGMLIDAAPFNYFENKTFDFFTRLSNREVASPVVIIEIDDESIKKIGAWPWPRSYIAEMVDNLSQADVKAVGIEPLYSGKETNTGLNEIARLKGIFRNKSPLSGQAYVVVRQELERAEKRLDNDRQLYKAILPTKNIVLPIQFVLDGKNHRRADKMPEWLENYSIPAPEQKTAFKDLLLDLKNPFKIFTTENISPIDIVPTYAKLASGASRHGHITYMPDSDDIVRKDPLLIEYQGRYFPSFSLQMSLAHSDTEIKDLKILPGNRKNTSLRTNDLKIPTDMNYNMHIAYNTGSYTFNRYPFHKVRDLKIPKGILKDKLVIIGKTAPDIARLYDTPYAENVPAVEIMANSIDNILNRKHILRPDWAWLLETLILLYFCFLMLFVVSKVSPSIGSVVLISFLFTWYGIAIFLFINSGFWFKIFPPTALTIIGLVTLTINQRLSREDTKKDEITRMNKMLGLSFQGQGLLDMAFDSFMKCDLEDPSVKEALFNLALDFERKRMHNKAVSVYEYLLKGGPYKDSSERMRRLRRAGDKVVLSGAASGKNEATMLLNNMETRPTLGRYEVIKEIGQGAIGTVYLGRDPKINRKVAIKTLRYNDVDPQQLTEVRERFFREAEAAGRLSHPNIVTIYDCGQDYDVTYLAMEFLDGHDLTRYCKKSRLLPAKMSLNIITRVAFALDYAHKNHVVHRDIKPANIMLTEKGHIKVTDFGIARLTKASQTQTGVILGTPNYMSPEQVLGKKVDGRSDLFSLGSVFYELLTGEKPFKSDNIGTLMHNISTAQYRPVAEVNPEVPECCVQIVEKLLQKSPAKRFRSAGEVVIEAQRCFESIG